MSKPFKLKYKNSAFPFFGDKETILDQSLTESNALIEASLSLYKNMPKYKGLTPHSFFGGRTAQEYIEAKKK
tara:strand:- start:259 stop:474 length:216 start_codon:yes stop_codon:yes gene_type:complete